MTIDCAKEEFVVRLYHWSRSQFEREIHDSFPTLRTFKSGHAWNVFQFMQTLGPSQQLVFAHALLKRYHREAVAVLDERQSREEEILLVRFYAFWQIRPFYWFMRCFEDSQQVIESCLHMSEASIVFGDNLPNGEKTLRSRLEAIYGSIPPSFAEELEMRKVNGEKVKFASKRKLQSAVTRTFLKAFGEKCINVQSHEMMDPSIDIECAGWTIETLFWFGRSHTLLNLTHAIVSPNRFAYREVSGVRSSIKSLANCLSVSCWLGIAGQWDYVLPNEIESTCESAIKLCSHFFGALSMLLEGLEYSVIA